MYKSIALIPVLVTLAACATAPAPLKGEFSTLAPSTVVDGSHAGERIRWGGQIIKVSPEQNETCFEILSHELDNAARPHNLDSSNGRFIACRAGFYDPEVFVKEREMTVVGTVSGTEAGRIGQFNYNYPKVSAEAIYLWPRRPIVVEQRYPWPYYDPFWGPGFGPYWGSGYWW